MAKILLEKITRYWSHRTKAEKNKEFSSSLSVKMLFILLAIGLGLGLWQASKTTTGYSLKQFFPKNHPLLIKDKQIRKTFSLNEKSPYIFVIHQKKQNAWLAKGEVNKLKKLTRKIQDSQGVAQVLSMTSIEGASETKTELFVGNIFDRVPQKKWKNEILGNPLLYPLFITADFRSTLIAVEPTGKTNHELVVFYDKIHKMIQKDFPKSQIISAGVPLVQTHLSKMIQTELSYFLVIAIVVFCALFYLLFSHWTAIACAFAALFCANAVALGLLAFLGIPLNIVLITLPIIVSVSVMSLLIHTLHLFAEKKYYEGSFNERWKNAQDISRELFIPNFLGAFTTALGFFALATSSIPMIQQYGWVVALIVSVVCIYTQVFILVSLIFVKPQMRVWFSKPANWALSAIQNPKPYFYITLTAVIIGAAMISQVNFSGKLFDDLPKSDNVRASMEWVDRVFGGIVPYEVTLSSSVSGFWKNPQNLIQLDKLSDQIRKNKAVGSVVTVADFFQTGIPKKKGVIAETFFLFSMAEKNTLGQYISEDGRKIRISMRLKDENTVVVNQAKTWIKKGVTKSFPKVKISEGGLAAYSHKINQDVSKSFVFGFWEPLLGIGLFLVILFRSFKWAFFACLPNLMPPAILIGSLALTQTVVKPGIALIFSIALGFAFNNTIYILSRLRSLLKEKVRSGDELQRAILMEAKPCLFESFVMLCGFSIFILSHFSINRSFGVFMMIAIVSGFVADLFFLPAFLKLFVKLEASEKKPTRKEEVENSFSPKELEKIAASFILVSAFLLTSFYSPKAFAKIKDTKAQDILKKSQIQLDAQDEQSEVEMKIIEKNGDIKTRKINLKSSRARGFDVLARILSPADVKGMAFLGRIENGEESQWIYLPSSGQTRRLVTGKTKTGLLGSEISPEDLNSQVIKTSAVKLSKSDSQFNWIELIPKKGTSEYTKIITKISKSNHLPVSTEYYVSKKIKKSIEFKNYVKKQNVWRAQLIDVKNHFNGRGTSVKFSKIKLNSGLSSKEFSQSALKGD